MADTSYHTIKFGGKISQTEADELNKLYLQAASETYEDYDLDDVLVLGHLSPADEDLVALIAYCHDNLIAYRWVDHGHYTWNPCIEVYNPVTNRQVEYRADQDGTPLICAEMLRRFNTINDALAYLADGDPGLKLEITE